MSQPATSTNHAGATMQSPLEELEKSYISLQAQINLISMACTDQCLRDQISAQYILARQNYWNCVNKAFHDDAPQVESLTRQLADANLRLTSTLAKLDDLAKVLDIITEVVSVGGQLAAKVIAL